MSPAKTATLIATLADPPSAGGEEIRELSRRADCLEVRADLIGDPDVDWLRQRFDGNLLYTLRSVAEGGGFEAGSGARQERLSAAAERYDFVDLEVERDTATDLLDAVAPQQRVLSWHAPDGADLPTLRQRFQTMAGLPAAYYKLVPTAIQVGSELAPLELLVELGRDDVVAFAAGGSGAWTRLVAPRLGASVLYAATGATAGAPGQLTVERLLRDFGLPELPEVSHYYGILGNPVGHSLSPRLHNGGYRSLGLDACYLAFEPASFGDFWLEVVESPFFSNRPTRLCGLSVTAPFKAAALAVAGESSHRARRMESANTLIRRGEIWEATSTDPEGVVGPLRRRGMVLEDRRAAVLGAGGAGRAAVVGLVSAGCEVTLFNRSESRGLKVAASLGVPFLPLDDLAVGDFDYLVNATSLGHRQEDELPFDPGAVASAAVVIDLVYGEEETALVRALREGDRTAVGGREVLLFQAIDQFRLLTGEELPLDLGLELLGLEETA